MCMTSRWFSTKRHMRPIYCELKWIIPATFELDCWECCWVFEVFVELWPESLTFLVLITNSLLNGWLSTTLTHQMPTRTQCWHPLAPPQLLIPIQHTKQPPALLKPRPGACTSNTNQHTKRQYPAPRPPPPQPHNTVWWCQSTPTLPLWGFLIGLEAYPLKPIPLGMGLILI